MAYKPWKTMPNEMDPELLSLHATNSFVGNDSGARSVMYGSHFTQRLVIKGANEKRVTTGVDVELGKYTFKTKMPVDGRIIKLIERYPKGVGADSIPMNPETLVIFEDEKTGELGCFSITNHTSYHQYFGYDNVITPEASRLMPGQFVPKDTVFADTPAIGENGSYMTGIDLNVAMMSKPGVSEDGMIVCEDVLDRLSFTLYEKRIIEYGTHTFPLNLYPCPEGSYKAIPEIGEFIRDDGIVAMLRKYDLEMMPVEIGLHDVKEPDYTFDVPIYARGPGGQVVDIKVYHDDENPLTPFGMTEMTDKYANALRRYYREILSTYQSIRSERRRKFNNREVEVPLKPNFSRLIVEAQAIVAESDGRKAGRLNKIYRKTPLDDYRIEITIKYQVKPTIGFKLTDEAGGKGVICKIARPEDMPVDADGVRADIIVDSGSTISRMNTSRLYKQYLGSCSHKVRHTLLDLFGLPRKTPLKDIRVPILRCAESDPNRVRQAYQYLLDFYKMCSIPQHDYYAAITDIESIADIVAYTAQRGLYLFIPIDNEIESTNMIRMIENSPAHRPTYGPVTYTGNSGIPCTTVDNVRIGSMYFMLLEKIADDWSSVSSGKLQHFGILTPMTKSDKYAYPFRNSPVRTIGETEGRIFVGACGREATAEMMDRSNSTITHRAVYQNILTAPYPTRIERAVNRTTIPLGSAKQLQLLSHITLCAGFRMQYVPESR